MDEVKESVETVDSSGAKPKCWRTESGIHAEVQFENGIHIDLQVDMTDDEVKTLYQRLEDQRTARIQRTVRLYFGHRKTLREIATELGISKSQVFKDLQGFKQESIMRHKHELLKNHSPMSLMIDLETQTNERMRVLWEKFEHLEQFLRLLSPTLKRTQQRLSGNPDTPIRKSNNLSQESRECRALIESQKNLLTQIRNETQQLLNIYNGFGLSLPVTDPCLITKDLDLKMQELIIFIQNLVQTVRLEIPDKTVTDRIFTKMQELIRTNALVNQWVDKEDDEEPLRSRVLDR